MSIALVRIDDRLIHGQVVESWIPRLRADTVCVVSDGASQDATQKTLMALALPENIELEVFSVDQAAKALVNDKPERSVLVLAPSPKEVLALLQLGVRFTKVNVGGLHYSAGRVQLGKVIYISEEDRNALKELLARGVSLEGRGVPSDEPMDIAQMLT